jgi:hypothetical protein
MPANETIMATIGQAESGSDNYSAQVSLNGATLLDIKLATRDQALSATLTTLINLRHSKAGTLRGEE